MLVLDIDGTLLDDKKQIPADNKMEIKNLQEKGIPVTLCTGRNLCNTVSIVEELNIKLPVVCSDGAIIYDPQKEEIIKEHALTINEAESIFTLGRQYVGFVECTTANKYIKFIDDKASEKYNLQFALQDDESYPYFLKGIEIRKEPFIDYEKDGKIHQIIFGGEKKALNQMVGQLNYPDITVRDTLWENYFFIHKTNVSKLNGVKELCKILTVDLEEVVAMGDEANDLDMIEHVGLGIAMGNSCQRVLDVAKTKTLTNNESGVAHSIREYFF